MALSNQLDVVIKLSEVFLEVVVLTGSLSPTIVLPKNVQVINLNWHRPVKFVAILKLLLAIWRLARNKKNYLFFSHMNDLFAAISAPLLKFLGVCHVFWYAHAHRSGYLVFAKPFVTAFVSSTPGSFPLKTKKLYLIGQGVDENIFGTQENCMRNKRAIFVGRLDASKQPERCLDTVLAFSNHVEGIDVIGSLSADPGKRRENFLFQKYDSEITSNFIRFLGAVPRAKLPFYYSQGMFLIHNFQGSLDKVLIEATLLRCPVVTTNQEYLSIFGKWGSGEDLDTELKSFLSLDPDVRQELIEKRRALALENHTMQQWILKLVQVLTQVNVLHSPFSRN